MSPPRVRVYCACSLDGFLAGPDDDIDWLSEVSEEAPEGGEADPGAVTFDDFFADVGALLMGRRTHDVLHRMGDAPWPYADRPILVPTHRPLEPVAPTVRAVNGDIEGLVAEAREAAGGKDVYVDGGEIIRAALDAGLVDELIVTLIPVVLGDGIPLFAGTTRRHWMRIADSHRFGDGLLQLHLRPAEDQGQSPERNASGSSLR